MIAADRQIPNCMKKQNKIWRKTIFNIADGIITPLLWHDHDTDFARWLHPAMRVWNYDSEFTKWQHNATRYVALGWHAIEFARLQHPAMWQVALGWRHEIRLNDRHIGILHLVSILTISPQSTCHSAPVWNFIQTGPSAEKMTSCLFSRWRSSAILDFRGPIMGSLKSPCK